MFRNRTESARRPPSPFFRLYGYTRDHRRTLLGVMMFMTLYNVTVIVRPYLIKVAIDRDLLAPHAQLRGLVVIGAMYLGLSIIGPLANYGQNWYLQSVGQVIVRRIRLDLFAHLLGLPMQFFDEHATGRLITNVVNDTTRVSQFFTNFLLSVGRDGLTIVMVMGAMVMMDWRLALVSFVIVPVVAGIAVLFRGKLRQSYERTRSELSRLIGNLAENLSGMNVIQAFGQESKQQAEFDVRNGAYLTANVTQFRWAVLFNRSFDLLGNLAVALMMWAGSEAVLDHTLSFGVLYAFITYIQQFFRPINSITQQWNTLQSALISGNRIGQILLTPSDMVEPPNPVRLAYDAQGHPKVSGQIELQHVDFGYSTDRRILRDVSLQMPAGSFVGVVGETGAGKSTLIGLIARFYDVTQGAIRIDGIDIRQFRLCDLHRLIMVVQQEVSLFTGTVLDNIRLFREEISYEAVVAAAQVAGAHEFIQRLPQGYRTRLSPNGSNLSLGQRQLLAFARAVVLDAPILILDEATANLDSETEQIVQKSLARIAQGRTTIVIAHRLSTIRAADCIYVMAEGRIEEFGSHATLMAQHGAYAGMVRAHTTYQSKEVQRGRCDQIGETPSVNQ